MSNPVKLDETRLLAAVKAYTATPFRSGHIDSLRAAIQSYISSGPEGAAVEMREALTTVLTALEASRGHGAFPDFHAWELSARAALALAEEPQP